jgi:hypothetical protein
MTLLVVDMQTEFRAAKRKAVIAGVVAEIAAARLQRRPVMLLGFMDAPHVPDVLQAVKGYRKAVQVVKFDDDGSEEALEALYELKWPRDNLRVCGVHLGACVAATVVGLADHFEVNRIEVAFTACGSKTIECWDMEHGALIMGLWDAGLDPKWDKRELTVEQKRD